jgi:hypothetical protein
MAQTMKTARPNADAVIPTRLPCMTISVPVTRSAGDKRVIIVNPDEIRRRFTHVRYFFAFILAIKISEQAPNADCETGQHNAQCQVYRVHCASISFPDAGHRSRVVWLPFDTIWALTRMKPLNHREPCVSYGYSGRTGKE